MIDHFGFYVSDFDKSIPFLEACLAPLGIKIWESQPEWNAVIFADETKFPFLWVGQAQGEYYGTKLSVNVHRPIHIGFKAPSKQAVREFHRLGLEHGGRDNGKPEDCGRGYFGAYLLDPDGNNIEAGIRS